MDNLDNKTFESSDHDENKECEYCDEENCKHSHCRLVSWDMENEFDCPNCKSNCTCDFIKQLRKYKKQKKIIEELKETNRKLFEHLHCIHVDIVNKTY